MLNRQACRCHACKDRDILTFHLIVTPVEQEWELIAPGANLLGDLGSYLLSGNDHAHSKALVVRKDSGEDGA